jgi:DNA repair exonuclease SbcCD nuclease subunit
MKIAILGDTHIGVRQDSKHFSSFFEKYVTDILIPNLIENKVTDLFQLGDLFDRRKYINFNSLAEAKRFFFDALEAKNIKFHTLLGNHDIFWRESLSVNSTSLVLGEYSNVIIYDKPTTVSMKDGTTIDVIPWICKENEEEVMEFIKKSKSDLCFGHFEFTGFNMYKGVEAHGHFEAKGFEKYELVCSGHYHTKSQKGNVLYVGTPYEMTWQDYNDPRGHHLFDLETRKITFHQNPYTIFVKLEYDDTEEVVNLDALDLQNCYVRLIVVNKTDYYKFDNFTTKLYNKGCIDIKIVEDFSSITKGEVAEDINLEDTMSILSNYVDSVELDLDKTKVKSFLKNLYIEAVNLEA